MADDATNIYNHDGANTLSPVVAGFPNLVYVPNSNSNTVDVINPSTGAIVEHFERLHRIDWRDPTTMALIHTTPVPCSGINHADFSADGRYFIVSCEFDGRVLKIDTLTSR